MAGMADAIGYQCHDWYGAAIPINCSKLPILPILKVHFSADMSLQTGRWSSVMHSVALALALACQWH